MRGASSDAPGYGRRDKKMHEKGLPQITMNVDNWHGRRCQTFQKMPLAASSSGMEPTQKPNCVFHVL